MTQLSATATPTQSLSALLWIMDAARGARDVRTLAQAVLERALAVTGMASGSIWLRGEAGVECLTCYPDQQRSSLPPDLVITRVMASGRPEFLDMGGRENEPSHPQPGAVLPLIAGGEVIGALVVAGARTEPARALLDAVAAYIAGALQQARLSEQVALQRRRLQVLKRQQDQLISIILHDLKNPMASIKGYADLLLRRSVCTPDDPNRRGLQVISEQVVRMNGLLDQLLDISRISTDRLRIERRPADLASIMSGVVSELRGTAGRRAITLEGADAPLRGAFDTLRISRAIGNVISNAITYSPEGSEITVRLDRAGHEAIIAIRDRGIGIPAAECERIFEPSFHASNAAHRSSMGMGLFVAQQIVAQHGGRIWFESTEGQGTMFSIALPLEPS